MGAPWCDHQGGEGKNGEIGVTKVKGKEASKAQGGASAEEGNLAREKSPNAQSRLSVTRSKTRRSSRASERDATVRGVVGYRDHRWQLKTSVDLQAIRGSARSSHVQWVLISRDTNCAILAEMVDYK